MKTSGSTALLEGEPRCVRVSAQTKAQKIKARYKNMKPGSAAEASMVEEYLPLVKTVVGRLAMSLPPHVDPEDLYSSGLVGLLNAVRQYDPLPGVPRTAPG